MARDAADHQDREAPLILRSTGSSIGQLNCRSVGGSVSEPISKRIGPSPRFLVAGPSFGHLAGGSIFFVSVDEIYQKIKNKRKNNEPRSTC